MSGYIRDAANVGEVSDAVTEMERRVVDFQSELDAFYARAHLNLRDEQVRSQMGVHGLAACGVAHRAGGNALDLTTELRSELALMGKALREFRREAPWTW